MEKKVKAKIVRHILDNKRIIKEFDEYIHSKEVYKELISMKCTQYSVVDIIREVWEEIKGGF